MKTIVLIAVLGTAFLLPAQIVNGGGGGSGTVTHTGNLTADQVAVGNGTADIKPLAGPTATNGVAQVLTSTPSGGVAGSATWIPSGVATNAQTGATYTVAATDRTSYVTLSNAGAIAVTLPQAGSTGFANNFAFVACDIGAGTATITPTTSNISYTSGSAYTAAAASIALTTGQCAWIYSDNSNYFAIQRTGGSVTSVGGSFTGGLVSVAGSPITSSGTLAFTVAGTSGGIPYFSGATTWASSGALTSNVLIKGGGAGASPAVSLVTDDGTTATYTGTGGYSAPKLVSTGANAGAAVLTQGTAQGHATANTVTIEAPAAVTAYEVVLPGAAASGIPTWTNAASVVTESVTATSGSGNVCLATSCAMTTPKATTIQDANANPFILSSATASAVDSITITNAATANPATVTIAGSGTDTNINTAINAKGSGTVNASTYFQATSNRIAMTADWTCGTSSISTSCTAATIVGTNGTPLTLTLPLQAQSWHLHCEGVVGQATAATSNQWNLLTATNGATNVTATYKMATAATASAYGAVTDQAATTTTFQIAPNWTLGGVGTKMPFSIDASIESASASGTVVSLQLLAPTAADVVTIYRGAFCSVSSF